MKTLKKEVEICLEDLDKNEIVTIQGGDVWADFWRWLGRSHGSSVCSINTEADYDAAMERWRRGSMI
jgi:hypothetical protein